MVNLLLVEANQDDALLLHAMLTERQTFEAHITHRGTLLAAQASLVKDKFDLILLDLSLPDSLGWDTFEKVRELAFDIPIIILTGNEDRDLALKALQAGAQDFVPKDELGPTLLSRSISYALERHQLQKQLIETSITDDLTGLYNRRGFTTISEQQVRLAQRTQQKLLYLFIDLDGLKKINDAHGHPAGDKALQSVAQILQKSFRNSDILGRVGGDEFSVLAVETDRNDINILLNRLRTNIEEFNRTGCEDFKLSLSVGISEWMPDNPKDFHLLMQEADAAMYAQKREKQKNPPEVLANDSLTSFISLDELFQEKYALETALALNQILIVEDNPGDARLVQEFIKDIPTDYEVILVTTLSDTLTQLKEEPFTLILLDLSLPDSHGLQTLEKVMDFNPDIPIVVMTGLDDQDVALKAMQLGAQDYLTKGTFDEALLDRSVQYAIERQRLKVQNLQFANELQHREARLQSIFNNVAIGMYRTTPNGEIRFANNALNAMLGFNSLAEIATRNLEKTGFVHQQARTKFKSIMEQDGQVVGYESVWKRHDGSQIFVRESAKAIKSVDGAILYYEGTAEDISAQIEAEQQVRLQAAALDAAANAILITDRKSTILWANPAFTDLTGYTLEEAIGQKTSILKSGQHDIDFYKGLWDTVLGGMVWQGTMTNRHKNGQQYAEEMTITPLFDAEGEVYQFIAIKQDITARKQAEDTLHRQLDQLWILNYVANVGVEATDEDELISQVTEIIGGSFYSDHFGILILDGSGNYLDLHPSYKGIAPGMWPGSIGIDEGIVGSVVTTGKSRRIPDVSQVPEYLEATPGIQSNICIPLNVADRIIGVINAESKKLAAFTEDDERLLTTVAGQLATAIEQIRNRQAEREQRLMAETLSDSALAINSSLSFDLIVEQLLTNVARIVPHKASSVMLRQNGQVRVIRHRNYEQYGETAWLDDFVIEIEDSRVYSLMSATGQPLVIFDTRNSDDWIFYPQSEWIRSYLGVPIQKDRKIFGFLNLDHSEPGHFSNLHAESLQILAHQLAIAMENSRLYTETQQRAAELDRLYQASGTLLTFSPSDPDVLAQAIVETVRSNFGQSNCSLLMVQPGKNELLRAAMKGPYVSDLIFGQNLKRDGRGLVPTAIREEKIINVGDVTKQPDYVPNWKDARSEMVIPLKVAGRVIGAIDVQSKEVGAFSQDDERIISVFAERAALSLDNANLYENQQRQLSFLESLRQIDLAITGSMDIKVTLDVIVKQVLTQLKMDAVNIMLLDPYLFTLKPTANIGFRTTEIDHNPIKVGEGLAGLAAQHGRVFTTTDFSETEVIIPRRHIFNREGFQTCYVTPLAAKGQVKGVMEVFSRQSFEFDAEWENYANTVSTQTAIAVDNATMFENLQRSHTEISMAYDTTLEGWAKALELRDRETEGHARRVVDLTLRLSQILGISRDEIIHVRRGAILHDVGKMGIPDKILQKPGPLSDEEWEVMRQHPIYAYEWLNPINYLRPALDIPHYHHERWDGTGYPRGLQGEQIPLPARIFAIVDVWDALRSDRPYRKAWSYEKTFAYIQKQSESHFDPQVVAAFLGLVAELEVR
jgi:diguanylate cyclase (GGDEF)-like protein/PAS domain S-box-containing protein